MNALERRNNALLLNNPGNAVNGKTAQIALTTRGSDWYFAVCAVMTLSGFIFMGLAMRKPRKDRIFYYLSAAITLTASCAYFSLGSHLGFTPVAVEFQRSDPKVAGQYREIYWIHRLDDHDATALDGSPTNSGNAVADHSVRLMIITGLVGALVQSRYKWGYFTFGCFALFYITYHLLWESRRNAQRFGADVGRAFLMCGSLTALVWLLYPLAWGLCEGGNVISVDSEAIFYGILDLLAKPVFSALLIWNHRNIDPARLGLRIYDYEDFATDAGIHEKRPQNDYGTPAVGPNTSGTTAPADGLGGNTPAHPTHVV